MIAPEKKVAIVHYWLVGMRGGEKVLETLCDIYPSAHIYTHVVSHNKLSAKIKQHEIRTTWIAKLPLAERLYKLYLPLMPWALEALDLNQYDIIISSESGPAKGIIPSPSAVHICYCHSPMRYVWDQRFLYTRHLPTVLKAVLTPVMHRLRQWDISSSVRVDKFIANSNHVANRIQRYYRRDAVVLNPPVDPIRHCTDHQKTREKFYLFVGELVDYKRADLAIEACKVLGRKLLIAGSGSSKKLKKMAKGSNIEFLGRVPDRELFKLMETATALLFPGEEDFGIIPVEALQCGLPVIAYGKGGVLDSIGHDSKLGVLFAENTSESLVAAIKLFEKDFTVDREYIRSSAKRFRPELFKNEFMRITSQEFSKRKHQD